MIDCFLIGGLVIYAYLDTVTDLREKPRMAETIPVKKGNKQFLLKPSEILWIGAENYYISIHSTQGVFLERMPLKTFFDLLPASDFIRIHRSTVVNVKAIR